MRQKRKGVTDMFDRRGHWQGGKNIDGRNRKRAPTQPFCSISESNSDALLTACMRMCVRHI